jgi:hypothetical protein
MDVNMDAPLVVRRQIEVFAPPEMVWDWLSRVDLWQDWHPEVSSSKWLGQPGLNGPFKWRLRKVIGITAKVDSWDELRELGWTGRIWSTKITQVFRIEGDFRRTVIVSEAAMEGAACRFAPVRALALGQLERTNELWLGVLKTKLESEKFKGSASGGDRTPAKAPARPFNIRTGIH